MAGQFFATRLATSRFKNILTTFSGPGRFSPGRFAFNRKPLTCTYLLYHLLCVSMLSKQWANSQENNWTDNHTGRNQKQFFSDGKGAFEPSCPRFCPQFFLPGENGGEQSVSPQKNGTVAILGTQTSTQTSTQTGTNRHNLCRGRGEAHLPPFHCLLLQWPHPRTFGEGRGTAARPPDGDVRSGGRLVTGRCRGANVVPSVIPLLRRHNRHHRCCGPILLTLPWSLVAAAPPPLVIAIIY